MFLHNFSRTIKCLQFVNRQNVERITCAIQKQNYSDWYHRRPVKIVNEEEILEHAEKATGPNEFIGQNEMKYGVERTERSKLRRNRKSRRKLDTIKNENQFKDIELIEKGFCRIIELSENDPKLTTLMMSVRSKKKREKNDCIILEGRRLIVDAIDSGASPKVIVFSRKSDVLKLPIVHGEVQLFKVPYSAIQIWSTLTTSPGILGFFEIPEVEKKAPAPDALPFTIICDNVRDPGNMGSILRAAAAVGCKKLITLSGCVDIWEPKVLRSAAGCHFRMPIFASKKWEDILETLDPDANMYIADNNTSTTLKIDESETLEALNELELTKSEEIEEKEEEGKEEEEDEEEDEEDEEESKHNEKEKRKIKRISESKMIREMVSKLPIIPYYTVDYTTNENIIIVGGETETLSYETLNEVKKKSGMRLHIPMMNGVDSLNTSMALGIIAFEAKRQHAVEKEDINKMCN